VDNSFAPDPLAQARAIAERERRKRQKQTVNLDSMKHWRDWLETKFPRAVTSPFAPRHVRLWNWFDGLAPDVRPRPHCEFWPRGGAKSSTAEMGCVWVGNKIISHKGEARPVRRFTLYVSGTQAQANNHVEAIRAKFEDLGIERDVSRYGASRGWRVDMLRTATGFNCLALGLDAAARGVKLDDFRPDLIVLDDVDARHDTPETVAKKIKTITESILPAGSADCAILFVQNLIHDNSIAMQLSNGSADFLLSREQNEPEPAVFNLTYESVEQPDGTRRYVIDKTVSYASWDGQNLETCEQQLNDWGRAAFEREAQHNVEISEDGLWQMARDIDPLRAGRGYRYDVPDLDRIVIGVDPPRSTGQCGIVVVGRKGQGESAHGYVLEDCSPPKGSSTGTWCKAIIDAYNRWQADAVCVEVNYGGNMVRYSIEQTEGGRNLKIREVNATRGKIVRAEPIQGIAEGGRLHHAGVFIELEKELCNYKQGDESPNRLDAMVWGATDLMLGNQQTPRRPQSTSTAGNYR
jgi:hypothetical protein